PYLVLFSFFYTYSSPTVIYPLSLHDALPIFGDPQTFNAFTYSGNDPVNSVDPSGLEQKICGYFPDGSPVYCDDIVHTYTSERSLDRKSTRLNSSHVKISYAVFCLKKKKKKNI